ncbi:MAG: hypothetical protein GY820_34460 [Gammaproteobacteria bacterium]|nr:hypothetical protein [Gammaproteobacteria bacterium]
MSNFLKIKNFAKRITKPTWRCGAVRKGVGPPLLHWRCWGPIWFNPPCALLGGFPLNGISPRHNAIEHYALAFPSIMHGRKGGRELC